MLLKGRVVLKVSTAGNAVELTQTGEVFIDGQDRGFLHFVLDLIQVLKAVSKLK